MAKRINLNLIQSRLKIRQLIVFNAVLDEKSIVKAAEKLHVSQPSVTRTVRELEKLFGCVLLERHNRGVIPTVFGESLGRHAKISIAKLRHTVDEFNALQGGDEGHVIVGTFISASAQLLPRTIAALKKRSPRLVVTVREGTNDLLLPLLVNGEVDIVLGRIPDDASYFDVDHHTLYTEPLYALVNNRHPLTTARGPISLDRLLEYHWILPVSESPMRRQVQQLFKNAGLALPERIIESLSIATNLGLLDTIDAIALVPGSVARYFAETSGYCILEELPLGDFGAVGYSVSNQRRINPSTALFIECLVDQATRIAIK